MINSLHFGQHERGRFDGIFFRTMVGALRRDDSGRAVGANHHHDKSRQAAQIPAFMGESEAAQMSELNGFHGAEHYSRFTPAEWQELRRAADGEIEPGAVASLLKRCVGNFEYLSTDQLRQRCYQLCELHEFWGI